MLDLVYVLGVIVLFVILGLVAKAVERLCPPARTSVRRDTTRGEERR